MVTCTVTAVPESADTVSNSSSRTLVDQEDAQFERSFEKVEQTPSHREEGQAALVVELPEEDAKMADGDQESKARPPNEADASQVDGSAENTSDVAMSDAIPETVDQKVLNALEHQSRSSGTDQQDVEEVMGSIINRLQAAIRPSSTDEHTGIQLEKIMETFFVTTVNYTKKFDDRSYQHEISFDRSITAFPAPDGTCSLYDALGRNFDQQILEESKLSRYTAIRTLPPVLHVLIQRTQSTGRKNGNPVVIPETLYLDRYMDAPHDSLTFRRRVEDWAINDRMVDLKAQVDKIDANSTYQKLVSGLLSGDEENKDTESGGEGRVADKDEVAAEETWDFDGPVDDDFLVVSAAADEDTEALPTGARSVPPDAAETEAAVLGMIEEELGELQRTLEKRLNSMQSIPYRLHAVICHRGQLMSGHYWVWICDFEDRVWRSYNDESVRENRDTADVLHKLSTSGEPYYLCYVRDEDKEKYVDVPKREVPTPSPAEEATQPGAGVTDDDGDVELVDMEPTMAEDAVNGNCSPPLKFRIE